jgi:hypothetical protein
VTPLPRVALCLVLPLCGCAGSRVLAPAAAPAYGPRDRQLFDDGIDPIALGAPTLRGTVFDDEGLLRERARLAECTVRVRLVTATSQGMAGGSGFRLDFQVLEALAGPCAAAGELPLDSSSSAAPAVGTTMVAFVRSFAAGDGRTNLHFHLMAGGTAELRAVREAVLLASVR